MSFRSFLERVRSQIPTDLVGNPENAAEVENARSLLRLLDEYFFKTDSSLGATQFEDEELAYFSEFHKFWETNHAAILDADIDPAQTALVAGLLKNAVEAYGASIMRVTHDTHGLPPAQIAQVRFFCANQDFRAPPEDQFGRYSRNPESFKAESIVADPQAFLKLLNISEQSQTDKRLDFARNAANFLLKHGISAFQIAETFNNDAQAIRDALVQERNMGYGRKKANMFVRDMVHLGVWSNLDRYDAIDVASDVNTMKVALRTRILRTKIPLLSSFLDIFCHQYSYIDERSAQAWRQVWVDWKRLDQATAPSSPCEMDWLLYRIGSDYCRDFLAKYSCDRGHSFYYFDGRLKKCKVCRQNTYRGNVTVESFFLPCQVEPGMLPRSSGRLELRDSNFLSTFKGVCILEQACNPRDATFIPFEPPKSISVKGKTGWTGAYAKKGHGGGGLMS